MGPCEFRVEFLCIGLVFQSRHQMQSSLNLLGLEALLHKQRLLVVFVKQFVISDCMPFLLGRLSDEELFNWHVGNGTGKKI